LVIQPQALKHKGQKLLVEGNQFCPINTDVTTKANSGPKINQLILLPFSKCADMDSKKNRQGNGGGGK